MALCLFVKWFFLYSFSWYDCSDAKVPSEVPLCWGYCFTQSNNHKRFKVLKFIYFQTLYLHVFSLIVAASFPHFWNLPAFIWGHCSLILVTFSWFFYRFKKRHLFTCYKSSWSDNLLTQSCLLIPVSHVFVKYLQFCVLKTHFPHLVVRYLQHFTY